jgi:hypothetical protein
MIAEAPWDLDEHRKRLQKMTDEELLRHGKACAYMADPTYTANNTIEETYVVQLREARREYRRRHPKSETQSEPVVK